MRASLLVRCGRSAACARGGRRIARGAHAGRRIDLARRGRHCQSSTSSGGGASAGGGGTVGASSSTSSSSGGNIMREADAWGRALDAHQQQPSDDAATAREDELLAASAPPHPTSASRAEHVAWERALAPPPPPPLLAAVVECGSHSARLLVGDGTRELERAAVDTHLGASTSSSANDALSPDGVHATLTALADFGARLDALGVRHARAVATAAVRAAGATAERPTFLARAAAALGVGGVEVLSGEAEAELAFLGATAGLVGAGGARSSSSSPPSSSPCLLLDLGGRSTEIAYGAAGAPPEWAASLALGCLSVQAMGAVDDGAAGATTTASELLEAARRALREQPRDALGRLAAAARGSGAPVQVVVTGGTATTAAAMLLGLTDVYDRGAVHGSRLSAADALRVAEQLSDERGRAAARRRFAWLTCERAASMAAGCAALAAVLADVGGDSLVALVADSDLLDGALASVLARPSAFARRQ